MDMNRAEGLREHFTKYKIDALLVSNSTNVLYLTGFQGLSPTEREAFCLVTNNNLYLFTDPRQDLKNVKAPHFAKASRGKQNIEVKIKLFTPAKKFTDHLKDILKNEQIKRLGFEEEDLTYAEYKRLQNKLEVIFNSVSYGVAKVREKKEKKEVAKIKKACDLSGDCLHDIIPTVRVGQTEKEIGWKIEKWIRENGFDLAFDPIVASAANAAIPHYDTKHGQGKITKDSLLLIDMGVRYQNYNADITRMFSVGTPSTEIQNVYEILRNAQKQTVNEIARLGKAKKIDEFCRNLLEKHDLPTYAHSTGHGVGLEVHESPNLSPNSESSIEEGMVITVEPGIYISGKFGMRIEDTIYVGENEIEVLSQFPTDLQII